MALKITIKISGGTAEERRACMNRFWRDVLWSVTDDVNVSRGTDRAGNLTLTITGEPHRDELRSVPVEVVPL